jgi:hypothetical protein
MVFALILWLVGVGGGGVGLLLCMLEREVITDHCATVAQALLELTGQLQVGLLCVILFLLC